MRLSQPTSQKQLKWETLRPSIIQWKTTLLLASFLSEVEEGTILLLCLLEILLVLLAITLSLDSRWPRGYDDDDFKKIEEESDKNLVYLCVLQTLRR